MDPSERHHWHEEEYSSDFLADDFPPIIPPDDGDGDGGGGPRRTPRPKPDGEGRHIATLAIIGLMLAMGGLQMFAMTRGWQGGEGMVWLISILFAILFLGPFYAGAYWFDKKRRAGD